MARGDKTGGRPTKLTYELQARVCDALRAGNYLETAAAFAGIAKSTLYDWLRRGAREKSGPYHDFAEAVAKAQADAEARDVALVGKAAAAGNWQAAAWRLERKHPERWGRRDCHRIDAAVVAAHTEVRGPDPIAELDRLLSQRARELSDGGNDGSAGAPARLPPWTSTPDRG